MRLGDLDALKEKLSGENYQTYTHEYGYAIPTECVMETIDNAPTVDLWQMRQEATENALKKAEVLYGRPQGKWEEPFEMNGKTYHKCNHCHISSELILIDKFCPNCGASMKGGAKRTP